jgi:hypothetical protein
MKTPYQLRQYFETNNDNIILRLQALYQQGVNHGQMGMFPSGDFSNFKDWQIAVGNDMEALEMALGIEDSSIFELYDEGHSDGLRMYNENPTWTDENNGEQY